MAGAGIVYDPATTRQSPDKAAQFRQDNAPANNRAVTDPFPETSFRFSIMTFLRREFAVYSSVEYSGNARFAMSRAASIVPTAPIPGENSDHRAGKITARISLRAAAQQRLSAFFLHSQFLSEFLGATLCRNDSLRRFPLTAIFTPTIVINEARFGFFFNQDTANLGQNDQISNRAIRHSGVSAGREDFRLSGDYPH